MLIYLQFESLKYIKHFSTSSLNFSIFFWFRVPKTALNIPRIFKLVILTLAAYFSLKLNICCLILLSSKNYKILILKQNLIFSILMNKWFITLEKNGSGSKIPQKQHD